jgi:hypothetical protein
MVGLVEKPEHVKPVADALVRAIQQPDMVRHPAHDQATRTAAPSPCSPLKFQQSGFETRHARDHVPRPDVLLGHLVFAHLA